MPKRLHQPPALGTPASQSSACVLAAAIAWYDAMNEEDDVAADIACEALWKAVKRYLRTRSEPGERAPKVVESKTSEKKRKDLFRYLNRITGIHP